MRLFSGRVSCHIVPCECFGDDIALSKGLLVRSPTGSTFFERLLVLVLFLFLGAVVITIAVCFSWRRPRHLLCCALTRRSRHRIAFVLNCGSSRRLFPEIQNCAESTSTCASSSASLVIFFALLLRFSSFETDLFVTDEDEVASALHFC